MNNHTKDENLSAKGLPYINNWKIVFLTCGINFVCVFLFFYGRESILVSDIVSDGTICGITTSFINVFIVHGFLRRMGRKGLLPAKVPVSAIVGWLPKNPLFLSLLLAIAFSILMRLVCQSVVKIYEVESATFWRFMVWKVFYSCVLSAKLVELAVLRYLQEDCTIQAKLQQHGEQTVKNPIPGMEVFKALFNTITADFGTNILMGLIFGSVVIIDKNVVIFPTTLSGIVLSGLILGGIVTLLMVYPVAKNVWKAEGFPPPVTNTNGWKKLANTPEKFTMVMVLPVMWLSVGVFAAFFTFFGFEELNFFQFFFVRLGYTTLLTKVVIRLAILCRVSF